MQTIKQVLMERDGMSEQEATMKIEDAREELNDSREELNDLLENGESFDINEFMLDWFGLETDYLFDLI